MQTKNFEKWDLIWVSEDGVKWYEKVFMGYDASRYAVVDMADVLLINKGQSIVLDSYAFAKPISLDSAKEIINLQ